MSNETNPPASLLGTDRVNIMCLQAVLLDGWECASNPALRQRLISAVSDAMTGKGANNLDVVGDSAGSHNKTSGQISVSASHTRWGVTIYSGAWIGNDFCELEAYHYSSETGVEIPDYSYANVHLDWKGIARSCRDAAVRHARERESRTIIRNQMRMQEQLAIARKIASIKEVAKNFEPLTPWYCDRRLLIYTHSDRNGFSIYEFNGITSQLVLMTGRAWLYKPGNWEAYALDIINRIRHGQRPALHYATSPDSRLYRKVWSDRVHLS